MRVEQGDFFLVDQRELDAVARCAVRAQIGLHLARRSAPQAGNARRTVMAAFAHHVGDVGADHFHAGANAFGDFQADAMHQHLIGVAAQPFPVIDLVHDFEVAGIAQRLGVGAVPDRALAQFGREHELGIFLGRLAHVAVAREGEGEIVASAPQRAPLLDQARLAGLECLDLVEAVVELVCNRGVGFQHHAIGAQQLERVAAEGAIFHRHQLHRLRREGRRTRRDLRLGVAGQELVELDEAVDEVEGDLGTEHRALGAADARGTFEDRQTGLLNAERDRLAHFRHVVMAQLGQRRQAAETDVVQTVCGGTHAHTRRERGKHAAGIVTRRAKANLAPGRTLQLFIRKHNGTSWRTTTPSQGTPPAPVFFRTP